MFMIESIIIRMLSINDFRLQKRKKMRRGYTGEYLHHSSLYSMRKKNNV